MAYDSLPVRTPEVPARATVATSYDAQWAAWQSRGDAHDRRVRRKVILAAPVLAALAGVVYLLVGR